MWYGSVLSTHVFNLNLQGGMSMFNRLIFGRLVATVTLGLMCGAASATSYVGVFDQSVPEGNAEGITSTISISDASVLDSLTVRVDINHPWIGDLAMVLTAPDGTVITLLDRPGIAAPGAGLGACCGSGADLNSITFDDFAQIAAEDIVSSNDLDPVATPTDTLSTLVGLSIAGNWTLNIADFAQGQINTGIPAWSLVFNEQIQPVPLPGAFGLLFAGLIGLRTLQRSR